MNIKDIHNIYILCGGVSVEHEISLISAQNLINALYEDFDVYPVFIGKDGTWVCHGKVEEEILNPGDLILETIDEPALSIGRFLYEDYRAGENNFFIPCLHGTYGEDGQVQGLLESFDMPYLGSGVLASSLCMDKGLTNEVLAYKGFDQADFILLSPEDMNKEDLIFEKTKEIGYPVFVKPCNAGSSVGVTKVDKEEDLAHALYTAFNFDEKILIEEGVIGRELEVAVMGNDDPIASLPGEHIIEGHDFFNYDSKYKDEKTVLKTPAGLEDEDYKRVRKLAEDVYKALGCKGLARVDIFLNEEGRLLVNEINTFPGMTEHSLFPLLWEPTNGLSLKEVLHKLIQYGLDEFEAKKSKQRTI